MSRPASPAGWQMFSSPDGRPYYYNPTTKETTWTAPVDAPVQLADYHGLPISRKSSIVANISDLAGEDDVGDGSGETRVRKKSIAPEPPKPAADGLLGTGASSESFGDSLPPAQFGRRRKSSAPPPPEDRSRTASSTADELSELKNKGGIAARLAMFQEASQPKEPPPAPNKGMGAKRTSASSVRKSTDNLKDSRSELSPAKAPLEVSPAAPPDVGGVPGIAVLPSTPITIDGPPPKPLAARMSELKLQLEQPAKSPGADVPARSSPSPNRIALKVEPSEQATSLAASAPLRANVSPRARPLSVASGKDLLGDKADTADFLNELAHKLSPGGSPTRPGLSLHPPGADEGSALQSSASGSGSGFGVHAVEASFDEELTTPIRNNAVLNMKELERQCAKRADCLIKVEKYGSGRKAPSKAFGPYTIIPCSTYLIFAHDGYDPKASSMLKPVCLVDVSFAKAEMSAKGMFKKTQSLTLTLASDSVLSLTPSPTTALEGSFDDWFATLTTHMQSCSPDLLPRQLANVIRHDVLKPSKSAEVANDKHSTGPALAVAPSLSPATTSAHPPEQGSSPERSSAAEAPKRQRKGTANSRPRSFFGLSLGSSQPSTPPPESSNLDDSAASASPPPGHEPASHVAVKQPLTRFFKHRPTIETLQEKGIILQDMVFGGRLDLQLAKSVRKVPLVVEVCTKRVEEKGMTTEGIYRLSGNSSSIQHLRLAFNDDKPVDLSHPEYDDINVITGTLKLYFRELADPLLTKAMYTDFVKTSRTPGDSRAGQLRELVRKLPQSHFDTLAFLVRHLARVATHAAVTKMDPGNLAIVFGPTLLRPEVETMETMMNTDAQNGVVKEMVAQCEKIFG
ncbi:Rho GTPase-activating protein 15 [Sorochytrium milnesiophthora]